MIHSEPLLQTSPLLNKKINKWGCYFMSLIAIPYFVARDNTICDPDAILHLYDLSIQNRYMEDDCFIKSPSGILGLMGFEKVRSSFELPHAKIGEPCVPIGRYYVSYQMVKDRKTIPQDIKTLLYSNRELEHFVLLNRRLEIRYDGHRESITCKYGILKDLRVVKFPGRVIQDF